MKSTVPFHSRTKTAGSSMLTGPMSRLGRWLDHRLFKIDVYELRGEEIVSAKRRTPRFKVQDISTWQQVFICFGVPLIVIKFADGRSVELSDKHEDLIRILERVVPEKELSWTAV